MQTTTRCPLCGLSQWQALSCKRCGASLTAPALPPVARKLHPALMVWLSPRETMRSLGGDPTRAIITVAWLSGTLDFLQTAALKQKVDPGWGWYLVVLAVLMGPMAGFARLHVAGALISRTARWLGGRADAHETRAALAWGSVPEVSALLLWIPALAGFGEELFTKATPALDASPTARVLLPVFFVSQLVLGGWGWATRTAAVAEVHDITSARTLAAMALAAGLVIASVVGVALVGMKLFP